MSKLIKNQVIKIECQDLTYEGLGVNREFNKPIFIYDFFPGEIADVLVTDVLSKFAFGKVIKLHKSSDNRKDQRYECIYSAHLINYKYDAQVEFKNNYFKNLLNRNLITDLNELDSIYHDLYKSPKELNYRNKCTYPLNIIDNKIQATEIITGTHKTIKTDSFVQNQEVLNETLNKILDIMNETFKDYVIDLKGNKIDNFNASIVLRCNNKNLISAQLISKCPDFLSQELIKEILEIKSIANFEYIPFNHKYPFKTKYNKEKFLMSLNQKDFCIDINGFFQINNDVADHIFNLMKNKVNELQPKHIIDAYCGAGAISQIVGNPDTKINGFDISPESIFTARVNAKNNNVKGEYIVGDANRFIQKLNKNNLDFSKSLLILDPPRAGIEKEMINFIKTNNPKNIIYMSCDARTLIRDIKEINDLYELEYIQGFDMFPNTHHFEVLSFLKLK
ncbi:23S rRNA (uracil(1939)-C(5))-methyltransferase RlmD [Mycoplasma sp. Pen4]|uniref:23S rRNA (uracil(1939)-C(5))-methyltransferase RlmD n=1 Tax=Mycoplasma sp. Pen4 TaxID=640330 RepID=UPI00165472F3|nr:23S rRNA (uracil(1939)-C(5))-methyltransferase RlmD [Mycoplasma sp. Pen4]QNM93744.1 23S rRNA (uracil(1939)-C(5))-methyltransferase RlmD [Mycoplasma sp. Pen4]